MLCKQIYLLSTLSTRIMPPNYDKIAVKPYDISTIQPKKKLITFSGFHSGNKYLNNFACCSDWILVTQFECHSDYTISSLIWSFFHEKRNYKQTIKLDSFFSMFFSFGFLNICDIIVLTQFYGNMLGRGRKSATTMMPTI